MKEVQLGPDKITMPKDWTLEEIDQMISVLTGDSFASSSFNEEGDGLPLVRIRDLKVGETDTFYSGDYNDKYLINKDDILIGMDGEFHTVQWKGDDALLNQRVARIKTDENINETFLFYKLIEEIKKIENRTPATTVKHLSKSDINEIKIPFPPLQEQKKIAEVLSTVDEVIEKTDEIIETTQELKRGLMQDLLTKGIGHDEFKEAQLGPKKIKIASAWDHKFFNKVIEVNPSYDIPEKQNFEYLPMDAVSEGGEGIKYWSEREAEECTRIRFREGDTVYAKITPCTENGKIGFVKNIDGEIAFGSTEFLVFSPTSNMDPRYVFYLTNLPQFRQVTISLMEGSTGRQRVPMGLFKENLKVPVPSLKEQKKISDILSTIDEKIENEKEYKETLEDLKKGLMQDLLTGQVRVTDLVEN
jgi:type I restriction enzyme S subunit